MKDTKILVLIFIFILMIFYLLRCETEKEKFKNIHPILQQVRTRFGMLNPKYSKIPLKEGDSAYTENKKVITLCLKNPDNGDYYDMNTIMYVALHELSHVVTPSRGHNEEFKKNFSILLREAARIGIYNPKKEIPQTYCGVGPND